MRYFSILLFLFSIMYGEDRYELQLLATKSSNQSVLQKVLDSGRAAGLDCYKSQDIRQDGRYYYIRCNKTSSLEEINKSIEKAKLAGLDYYVLKPKYFSKLDKTKKLSNRESIEKDDVDTYDISYKFFGKNQELIDILHNQNRASKEYIQKRREIFLQSIKAKKEFNGLYLKADSSKNFTKDKMDYNLRLEWDIFDDGFLGSQEDVKKALLKKEIEFDEVLDGYHSANLQLSLYKVEAIKNSIKDNYLKQQKRLSNQILEYNKKRYRSSLITATKFFEYKKEYDDIKHALFYYKYLYKEPYDIRIKPLISHIEDINMVDMNALINQAYLNSTKLSNSKKRMELSNMTDSWLNRFKTNVYVENKKHYFLDDSDTVAGVHVQIPLDYHTKDKKSEDIQKQLEKLREESIKKLISQNIKEIYHKIDYHKSFIKSLKNNVEFFKNELHALKIKLKYPLLKESSDPRLELYKIRLSISKQYENIWLERTEILKLLLQLQYLCKIEILSSKS